MRHIGKVVAYLILAVNSFFAGMLLLTAYSPHIHPAVHPVESCLGLTFPIFLLINLCFMIFWLIVRYKYALLPLLAFVFCYPQIRTYLPVNFTTKTVPEGSIKILSYNIMGFGNLKKENGKNAILEYIRESDADIVCLQEYHTSTVASNRFIKEKEVQNELKAYPYRHVQTVGQGGTNQIAIYSRFPILSARKLGYKSNYNGSAIYELKVNEDTITLINNHLESNKLTLEDKEVYEDILKDPNTHNVKTGMRQLVGKLAEASAIRSFQADSIATAIAASKHPYIIVCGDFNDTPISYTHRKIAENLNDAFTESGRGLGISYNQNKFYFRIDNILISDNMKAYNCTVDRSIKDSDHYPIWCYVKIKK